MELWFNYLDQILIFVIFAVSLNLLLGYAGQVSVAHAAFGAVGGYAMGYLVMVQGWNFIPGIIVGMIAAGVLGTLVGLPALRLSVEYLILLTLAISSVIIGVFTTFPQLGGSYGLIGIPKAEAFGYLLQNPHDWVLPLFVLAVLAYAICHRLGESAYGRVLKGIRDDSEATLSLGKNVFAYKLAVFTVSSALAGLAGGLYSSYIQLATPGVYGFDASLKIFAMVIFGGMANLRGSVLGAVVVVMTEPLLERQPFIDIDARNASLLQLIIYGSLLVVLMRARPGGLLPEGFSVLRRLRDGRSSSRVEMEASDWVPGVVTTDQQTPVDQTARHATWAEAQPVLEVRGLSKRFGGIVAAEDLNFDLRQGTITALVGPNGAGKTTVFNLLTGFISPDAGSVKLRGAEVTGFTPDHIARLGLVRSFQDVRLIPRLSCLANVMLAVQGQVGEHMAPLFLNARAVRASEENARAAGMRWLEFVGMTAFADAPAGGLSFGQSKLVALARVLATEAEVILLDEPASGIDTRWVDAMLDLVAEVKRQGRTICIVEHNLHVVGQLADHTYFMELGRISAEGTIDELTQSERLAEAYFGTV